MENYLYSLEAIMVMLTECYRAGIDFETGGILIGPKNSDRIITDCIASSSYAERNSFTYFQRMEDVEFLNKQLRIYQAKEKDFKGYFHRHPQGMTKLSGGDIDTCVGVLKSDNYKIKNKLVMNIITESNKRNVLPVFSYIVTFDEAAQIIIRRVGIKVFPNRCIEELSSTGLLLTGKLQEEVSDGKDSNSGQGLGKTEKTESIGAFRNTE